MVLKYIFPAFSVPIPYLNSETSVTHFSLGCSALNSRFNTFSAMKLLTSRENKELVETIERYTDGGMLAEPVLEFLEILSAAKAPKKDER